MRIVTPRALLILGCLLYIVGLHAAYLLVLAPDYGQRGFVYVPPALPTAILAWSTALAPSLWLPSALRRPSQEAYWLLYVLVLVPACVVPLYSLGLAAPQLAAQNLALVAAFALLGAPYLLPLPRLRRLVAPPLVFWALVVLAVVAAGVYLAAALGLRLNAAPLLDVYAVRADYRDTLADGRGADYAVHWLGYVLLPLLLAQALWRKSWPLLLIAALGEAELYAMTGFKSMLFIGALVVALWLALLGRGRNFGVMLAWGAAALTTLAVAATLLFREPLLAYFAIGRPVATPGLLTGYYFDFFAHNPQAHLGYSMLAFLGGYPYEASPPFVIGRDYFGDATMSANANIFADGFANFGYAGLFGVALLLAVLFWIADAVAARSHDPRPALLLGVAAFALANSGLLTTLLTHGLGLALLLIYFMPRRGERTAQAATVPALVAEPAI